MKTFATILMAAVMAAILSTAGPVRAAEGPTTAAIESAATAADHNAIADAYEAQAKQARDIAEMHDEMARSYGKSHGLASKGTMATHCKNLSASYRTAAQQYDQLAKAHRDMAAAADR